MHEENARKSHLSRFVCPRRDRLPKRVRLSRISGHTHANDAPRVAFTYGSRSARLGCNIVSLPIRANYRSLSRWHLTNVARYLVGENEIIFLNVRNIVMNGNESLNRRNVTAPTPWNACPRCVDSRARCSLKFSAIVTGLTCNVGDEFACVKRNYPEIALHFASIQGANLFKQKDNVRMMDVQSHRTRCVFGLFRF